MLDPTILKDAISIGRSTKTAYCGNGYLPGMWAGCMIDLKYHARNSWWVRFVSEYNLDDLETNISQLKCDSISAISHPPVSSSGWCSSSYQWSQHIRSNWRVGLWFDGHCSNCIGHNNWRRSYKTWRKSFKKDTRRCQNPPSYNT